MQVMLKLPVAAKNPFSWLHAAPSRDRPSAHGQLADVKKYKVAGVFKHGPKQFLALGTEQAEGLGEIRPVVLRA